jgi:hypothetical protein
MKKGSLCFIVGALFLLTASFAHGFTIAVDPLSTADVNFIWSLSGNIINITETWNKSGELFLRIAKENETGTPRYEVIKTKTNNTGVSWTSFEEELMQPNVGAPGWHGSNDADALDFAQGSGLPRTSTSFASVYVDELTSRDFLQFYNGTVGIGGTDIQTFYIDIPFGGDADGSGPPFALREEPNVAVIGVPEPATMLLLGFGLLGLVGFNRRKVTK